MKKVKQSFLDGFKGEKPSLIRYEIWKLGFTTRTIDGNEMLGEVEDLINIFLDKNGLVSKLETSVTAQTK